MAAWCAAWWACSVAGDPSSFVLLLTGPSGAGKSTVARAWADSRHAPTAWIDMDAIRSLVRSGRSRPEVAWDAEAVHQWRLAIRQSALLARTFSDADITSVIDVYAPPSREPNEWDRELDGLDVRTVHLFPSFETCRERDRGRVDPLDESTHRRNYDDYSWSLDDARPGKVITNDSLSITDTVLAIERLIGGSSA